MKEETRNEKFRRLGESRMSRIFLNMNSITNLSNKKNYMYSEHEIDELFKCYKDKGIEIKTYFETQITLQKPTNSIFTFSKCIKQDHQKETKEERFRRVAENRLSKVLSDMNLIANLSIRKHYTYSIQEVNELFQAYEDKGIEVRAYFEPLKDKFSFKK